ncbi:hypothetical protein [Flavobacterium maritimum]|uniref:hypothetical protein n=1 Tax=Flavobacterium maritimum TaxID=3149042 RepID=UPI0032B5ECA2
MPVTIIPITDHESYRVNGHVVYRGFLGNWMCNIDLSNKELEAFSLYEELIINNKSIKKHTKATYNG